tara:strand:+ start:919 stop:2178 length:1260 start_codon:yes stop_codon:yes gene_type:complete
MKRFFYCVFFLSPLIFSEINFLDRIAVIVDEGIIMESEVNDALENTIKNFNQNGERLPPDEILFERVLERLIMDEILLQKAKKFGVRITDQELNETLAQFANQDNLTLQEFKSKIESEENKSFKDFREQIKKEMIKRRIQSGLVRPKVMISEREIVNYIQSSEGESLISIEYKINQILLKDKKQKELLNLANTIITEITNGLPFNEASKKYSSLYINEDKGNLGWRTRSQIPTLFVDKIVKMEKNEIFGPIISGAGVHIIQLENLRGETIQTESQTLVQHVLIQESEIRSEKQAEDLINELYERLSKDEELSILARVYSDDPGSKLEGGKLDWAPKGVYDKKFEEVMSKTDIGKFSKPFKSAFGWHILKVLDRREKNISDDLLRDKAYGILFQRKYREQLENTLEEIRSEAFVDIKISS